MDPVSSAMSILDFSSWFPGEGPGGGNGFVCFLSGCLSSFLPACLLVWLFAWYFVGLPVCLAACLLACLCLYWPCVWVRLKIRLLFEHEGEKAGLKARHSNGMSQTRGSPKFLLASCCVEEKYLEIVGWGWLGWFGVGRTVRGGGGWVGGWVK